MYRLREPLSHLTGPLGLGFTVPIDSTTLSRFVLMPSYLLEHFEA